MLEMQGNEKRGIALKSILKAVFRSMAEGGSGNPKGPIVFLVP